MELLDPHELCMLERRIEEEHIIFRFELQPHSFGHKDELVFFLFFWVGEANELVDPLFDENFQSLNKDAFEMNVQLRNPNMQIGDFSLAELIDDLLNNLQLFAQNFLFKWTSGEWLDSRCDDLILVTHQALHFMELKHDLSKVLWVLLHILVVLIPESVEALVDAEHDCFFLLSD